MPSSSSSRFLAVTLAILFFPIGLAIGAEIGFCLAVVLMVVDFDGWWRVPKITFDSWGLPIVPSQFTPDERWWTDKVTVVVGILFAGAGMVAGIFLWRWLVTKLGWMSAEEVEAYVKRASNS